MSITAISAAAVGVSALASATKSLIEKSISWPTALITGISDAKIVLATSSSLNAARSSGEPPPLPIIRVSILMPFLLRLLAALIFSQILFTAPIPCTAVGKIRISVKSFFAVMILRISSMAAPVAEVMTPTL